MKRYPNVSGSIRRRLLLILLSGAVILSLGLFFTFQNFAVNLAEESQDNILKASATSILDAVSVENGELNLDLLYAAFSMLSNDADDRVFYAIRANEEFLTGYKDLPRPEKAQLTENYVTLRFEEQPVRLVELDRIVSVAGSPTVISVAVAQTLDGQNALLSRIFTVAVSAGLGVFALVVLLALISERATVSPLIRMTDSVGRRGPNELRPVAAPVPVEMEPLVVALNGFMDRLRKSLSRTEEFIADAAHRVRTPLATVRTHAEATLLRVQKEENREALWEMIRAIDESSRAAGQMLDHAMVTLRADDLEREKIDLGELATELVDRLTPIADLRDIELKLTTNPNVTIEGDPILIQSALRNLLDNAIKYSPPESDVSISVNHQGARASVQIQDQGRGFKADNIPELTNRFQRGENVDGIIGSGLGLTIAADVARAHVGELKLHNNKDIGACATLLFPSL
ncbi:MAG: sensor histidine kinase [Pseudomonadota bacterium]